ncbi:MAG: ABC transporter permease [Betaproteobacteria bacterium]|nr:ABC transporter permease [Betaproteobacteria bacterium]MBI2290982.1 ABC transporter permease [Betaproteobacteria bacterium]MBI3053523.1 ABC transporter permease [Betaproteobacteria bacterium]
MVYYIIRRVLYAIPIALGVSIICFSLVYLGPGDPIQAVMPDEASEAETQRIRVAYGFDKPIPIQYLLWLSRAVQGDFGNSLQHNRPVIAELIPALQNTFRLAVFAATLSFLIAFVAGGIAAYRNGTWIDKSVTAFAITGVSVPHYWVAIILVIIFAVELGMLPAIGMGSGSSRDWAWDLDHMKALVMPVIALSMIPMGIIMRTTRASVLEVLSQDYVETLRSKGLSELNVLRHVIKNASPTVLAVTGLQFGHLLGGSILIETVFVWPGSGLLLNEAIFKRDVPILQGTVLVLAIFFVFVNLIVDIMQTWLDPRIKRG